MLEDFPDGVWFVDLAPVSDPALVPATLAGILDVQGTGGLQGSITEAVAAYLRFRKALVILDNCEHLIQASAQLAHSLLASCESLTILATSREVLRVSGEIPYRVPSLALPELRVKSVVETIQKTESAQLFLQRAAAILPGFALGPHNALLVAQICQRLDGIPLAIELAAARVNVLSLDQIARRLDDRFNLLTGGSRSSLPRHQTLRATIEWSYDLLTEKESLLFRRLAVFVGGWTLEAAEAVCSGEGIESGEILDLLSHLADKSLVIARAGTDGVRYRRLETIRQFASEKLLASGEQYILRTQHCDFFLDLGKHACQETNPLEKYKWKVHLEQDDDNFRAALTWCLTQENIEVALRLLAYWKPGRGHRYSEICDWFEKIRAFPNTMNHPTLYAKLLTDIGRASWLRRNIPYAESVLQESETIWLRLKENGELGLAETWLCLGDILLLNEEYIEKAQLLVNQSLMLYQKHGNKRGVSHALFCLGKIALRKFDFIEAEQQFMKSHSRWQELGDSFETVHALNSLGELARLQDDYDKAAKYYKQCLRINRELRDFTLLSITLFNYAWVLLRRGDCVEAKALIEENLYISTEDGDRIGILYCFPGFAGVLVIIGKIKEAAHLLSAFVSLFSTSGSGPLEPPDQKEFDYYLKLVRDQLDEITFALSWKEGSKMTIEQAVAFALKETNI
ncbi:MAG TPA: tetratricopeptide repeat protein [Anaerolineales bacterium]|nr:tetratricopeptide repeat protein [Anaerolineales bacterium]